MSAPPRSRPWAEISGIVAERVGSLMEGVRSSHGLDHVRRVTALALVIGRAEGADLEIVEAAAMLHDIGRQVEEDSCGRECHARVGTLMATQMLTELEADPAFVEQVAHCVEAHRFRGSLRPRTVEARVVFDADKLDSIGAVGVGRAFLFAGEVGARLHNPESDPARHPDRGPEDSALREFTVKLRFVRDRLYTRTAGRLAEGRHRFMETFFEQIDAEVAGER